MFESQREILNGGRTHKLHITENGEALRYCDVMRRWQQEVAFRSYFLSLLSDVPYPAYYWETPPVTTMTMGRAFEFVLVDAPGLDRTSDPSAFSDQLEAAGSNDGVVAFENLGGDALLVAPISHGPANAYPHLATFVRRAPEWQTHALWQTVGKVLAKRMSRRPTWTSTAGGGVPWLHVRLDSRPKYYVFEAYKTPD